MHTNLFALETTNESLHKLTGNLKDMRIPNIVGSRNFYNHHPTVVLNMFHFSSQGTWRRCAYSLNDSQVGSERTAHRCLKQGQAANQKAGSLFELDGLA
jgi:hypothetical protein